MTAGHVYRIHTALAKPPKEKIVLCVGNGLFLWFNTAPRQRPAQLQAFPGDAPGLTKACYLDCGRATVFPAREFDAAVDEGRATDAFLRRVTIEVHLRAVTLANAHRQGIVASLKSLIGAAA